MSKSSLSGGAASLYLTKEQAKNPQGLPEANGTWHLLAFYVSGKHVQLYTGLLAVSLSRPTAGLFSGLTSHVMTSKLIYPRLVASLSKAKSIGTPALATASGAATQTATEILQSLGASGAVYAAVTLTALAFPHTEIALMIPPSFPIPIQWGVGGLLMIDIIGALRGWKYVAAWFPPNLRPNILLNAIPFTGSLTTGRISAELRLVCGTIIMVRACGTPFARPNLGRQRV